MTLTEWQNEVRERLEANLTYANEFQFAANDKAALIGQTSALLGVCQERLPQLSTALAVIEIYEKALTKLHDKVERYATSGCIEGYSNEGGLGDVMDDTSESLERADALVSDAGRKEAPSAGSGGGK